MESIVLESESSVVSTNEKLGYVNHSSTDSAVVDNNSTVFITLASTETVLVESQETQVILTGSAGPPGRDGTSEENMVYAKQVDFVGDSIIYRGEAVAGTATSAPNWRIRKVSIVNDDISETWADGNTNFDNVWESRAILIYS